MKKVLTIVIFPILIIGLLYLIISSVMEPVNFNKERDRREDVGIERLKDIRELQVAFKSVYGRYSPTIDSLIDFYNSSNIKVVMQIGSQDDSVAVANTERIRKKNRKITNEELLEMYRNGENLVFKVENEIPVKEALFADRPDFCIDSLAFIPFSGDSVLVAAEIRKVSGVNVPLFEACMPYRSLLKGMDNQLRINLDAEREDTDRYPGLKVGSVTAPNNNAGNWE